MKIRTDFVTNSSSSSYCVSLSFKPVNKKKGINLDFWPEDEDGSGDVFVNLMTSADEVASKIQKSTTIDELKEILLNEIDLYELFQGDIGEEGTPTSAFIEKLDPEDEDYEGLIDEVTNKYNTFKKALEKIVDVKDIESVSINEYYTGWGEFARDGVDDFLRAVLPDEEGIDIAEALEDKLTEPEIELIGEHIMNDSITMFNANINTTINLSTKKITKKYDFDGDC